VDKAFWAIINVGGQRLTRPMSQAAHTVFGVDDLGPDALLAAIRDNEVDRRRADLRQLELAYQWCVLHPATADTGVATWGDPHLEADESLGGEGTPKVAAFAPEPLGLALGVSTSAAMTLIADALDLVHRLPHTWRRVQTLDAPAWRARRVAQRTHALTQQAAAHVDRQLAPRLHTAGVTLIDRAVAQAIAKYQPEEQMSKEERVKAGWDVTLHHPNPTEFAGTSELHVVGDTLTLTTLYDQICATAADLKTAGDTDPLGARKAKTLGQLAGTPRTKLYLHLGQHPNLGRVENLGPATTQKIKDWIGHSQVTIQPVLHTDRDDGLDPHHPPGWMRDLVILRDPRCVFPHCQRDSQRLRPRPHHPLRRTRTTRPNQPSQPRTPVPQAPPRQDQRPMAIPPPPRRHLRLDRTRRPRRALSQGHPIVGQAWPDHPPRRPRRDPARLPATRIAAFRRPAPRHPLRRHLGR